jgi:hypothetical protein
MDTTNLFKDLNEYFSEGKPRSEIRVKEINEILIAYMNLARLHGDEIFGKFLSEIKTFNAPMSKKNWDMIVDYASFKTSNND